MGDCRNTHTFSGQDNMVCGLEKTLSFYLRLISGFSASLAKCGKRSPAESEFAKTEFACFF